MAWISVVSDEKIMIFWARH